MKNKKVNSIRGWAEAFGGVGNGVGASLEVPGDGLADAGLKIDSISKSAFTTVVILDETKESSRILFHPLVGELIHRSDPKPVSLIDSGELRLSLNRSMFSMPVEEVPLGVSHVITEIYRRPPDWGDNREYHTVITIVFRLLSASITSKFDLCPLVPGAGIAVGPCDHLGMILLDVQATRLALQKEGLSNTSNLIDVFGSTEIGVELMNQGALIAIWGMRPWLYRLAISCEAHNLYPLGRIVSSPRCFPKPPGRPVLSIVPGKALQNWTEFDENQYPRFEFKDNSSRSLNVEIYILPGFEPMAPSEEVGILPTILIEESYEAPPDGNIEPIQNIDPFTLIPSPDSPWSHVHVKPNV